MPFDPPLAGISAMVDMGLENSEIGLSSREGLLTGKPGDGPESFSQGLGQRGGR